MEEGILKKLADELKVSSETCENYDQIIKTILSGLQNKSVKKLVSVVETLIRATIQKDNVISKEATTGKEYKIEVIEKPNARPETRTFDKHAGAIIYYDPSYAEMNIVIAYQLGHLLFEYGILPGNKTINHIGLFAYFIINVIDDNTTYKEKSELIGKIRSILHITGYEQTVI